MNKKSIELTNLIIKLGISPVIGFGYMTEKNTVKDLVIVTKKFLFLFITYSVWNIYKPLTTTGKPGQKPLSQLQKANTITFKVPSNTKTAIVSLYVDKNVSKCKLEF